MRLFLIALFALFGPLASADPASDSDLRLEFYTGEWCPPCYRVKAMLTSEHSQNALTLTAPSGETLTIPIEYVDVPSPHWGTRYAVGAVDLYGAPTVPQFQLKRGEDRLTAFAFPWPDSWRRHGYLEPDFTASGAISERLLITLERESAN